MSNDSPIIAMAYAPAVMSTKEAHAYCSNKRIFDALRERYPKILKPLSTTHRGDSHWSTESIHMALRMAMADGSLIHKVETE